MSEEIENTEGQEAEDGNTENEGKEENSINLGSSDNISAINDGGENIVPLSGMYENWFLDYASYVILERAVPASVDGLKPVHRRILHSMKELDDGRYNKVANIIGNTMKYHPHGDASIGDALVQLGQKDLLIDAQGNWGNTLTGDRAAAPRYIEARLSKFALEVVFNAKTTEWLASYDGRNKEPLHLPIKFPLLLAQGAEGIAVGLACKMLPHNFIELIDASVDYLRGRSFKILPDFLNGGTADFTNYNNGLRGGKIRVRAKIQKNDSKSLVINEIPYGTTTTSLIDSVIKANDKGKIKIRKIEDNTAAEAEIVVHLPSGVSPDKAIDALYAFTDCEVSISPNSCVIEDDKPIFIGVTEILKRSADHTVELLKKELEIRKGELEEQWHFSSLEKIFIEKRIYRDIEEEETWEGVISAIDKGLKPNVKHLKRKVTEEDITRLTEIKIKRISKFDSFKADEAIDKLEEELKNVQHNLDNLIDYAVDYFKALKKKYGEGKERKTEIKVFDTISASKVIIANKKLYVNKKEGFIGWALKKDEYVCECSEIDDVIVFREDGVMQVTKVSDKKFMGKDLLYANVWKKGDNRTIYHMIYQDGKSGAAMMKRFAVNSITRDKEYDMTKGSPGSKVLYLTANPNGEKEIVTVHLRPRPHLKKLKYEVNFGELLIKGRGSGGNRITKDLVSKVVQKEVGGSTLAARKVWFDEVVSRLNDEERGKFIGEFKGEDKILTIYESGHYKLTDFSLSNRFDEDLIHIEKWHPSRPMAVVYYDGEKDLHFAKRFIVEPSSKKVLFITEHEDSRLDVACTLMNPKVKIIFNKQLKATKNLPDKEEVLNEFIDVKGLKALGNQLTKLKVKEIKLLPEVEGERWEDHPESENTEEDVSETKGTENNSSEVDEPVVETEEKVVDSKVESDVTKENASNKVKKTTKDKVDSKDEIVGTTNNEDPVTVEFSVDLSDETEEKPQAKKKNPVRSSDDDKEDQMTLF